VQEVWLNAGLNLIHRPADSSDYCIHRRCFQCRHARLDILDLDGLRRVIEDCLCRPYPD
jgi:hypothetical protein